MCQKDIAFNVYIYIWQSLTQLHIHCADEGLAAYKFIVLCQH